jgi:hypothetical protein
MHIGEPGMTIDWRHHHPDKPRLCQRETSFHVMAELCLMPPLDRLIA